MTFNKKLLLCGLAVGVTAFMLYQASKKKKQKQQAIAASNYPSNSYPQQSQSPPQQSGGHNWGAMAGGAALLAGGAGLAAHSYQSHQPSSSSPQETTWEQLSDWRHIAKILSECVQDQYLYSFYPNFASIEVVAKRIASTNALVSCADAWELPPSLAQDLVKLALFDIVFELDDSASMRSEGTKRRDALASILRRAADAAGRFDSDGSQVVWMNSSKKYTLRNKEDAKLITDECKYDGQATPMGDALLHKVLEPLVYSKLGGTFSSKSHSLQKPVLVVIITDGRPTGRSEVGDRIVKEIKEAKRKLSKSVGEDAISFTIGQVGNDRDAEEWLDSIDSNQEIGDLVDVTSAIDQEAKQVRKATGIELTEDLHCLKLLLGGVDSSFDQSDEPPSGRQSRKEKERKKKTSAFAQQRQAFQRETEKALAHAQAGPVSSYQPGHQKSNSSTSNGMMGGASPYPPQASSPYPQQQASPYPPQQASSPYPQTPNNAPYPPQANNSPYPPQGSPYPPQAVANAPYPPAAGSPYPPAGGQPGYPSHGAPPSYDSSYGQPQQARGAGQDDSFGGGFSMPGVQHHNPNAPPQGQQQPYPPPNGQQPPPAGAFGGFPDPSSYGGNSSAW